MGIEYKKIYKRIVFMVLVVDIVSLFQYNGVVGGGVISQIQAFQKDLQPINPFQQRYVILIALVGLFFIQNSFRLDNPLVLIRCKERNWFEKYYLKKLMALSAVYVIAIVVTDFILFWLLQQMPFSIQIGAYEINKVILYPASAFTYCVVMLVHALILNLFYVSTSFLRRGEKIRMIGVVLIVGCQAMVYYSPSLSRVFVFAFAGYAGFNIEDFPWLILKYLCWFLLAWVWRFKKRADYA